MGLERTVSGYTSAVATKDKVSSDLAGEAVILNLKSEVYYGLNDVGVLIWNLIQEPKTVNGIRDAILKEYEVEPDQCDQLRWCLRQSRPLALRSHLEASGLIEVRNERAA